MAIGGMTISISVLRNKNGLAVRATGRTANEDSKSGQASVTSSWLHQINLLYVTTNDPYFTFCFSICDMTLTYYERRRMQLYASQIRGHRDLPSKSRLAAHDRHRRKQNVTPRQDSRDCNHSII